MWPTQTPAIRVFGSGPRRENGRNDLSASNSSLVAQTVSPAIPMPIPNSRESVPPPLPPPRHLVELSRGRDPGWQWANFLHHNASNSSLRQPDSSAFSASSVKTSRDEPASPFAYSRRTSSLSTATLDPMSDDDRLKGESDASPLRSNPGTEYVVVINPPLCLLLPVLMSSGPTSKPRASFTRPSAASSSAPVPL